MYTRPYRICFSARAVEVLQDMTLSQRVLWTDLTQSRETVLKHNCQQIAFTWWTDRGSTQDYFLWCLAYGRERRHRETPWGAFTWAMTSEMEAHPTRKLYLCFSRIPAWVHAWKKPREKFGKWLWYCEWFQVHDCCFLVVTLYTNNLQQYLVWTWANIRPLMQRKHCCIEFLIARLAGRMGINLQTL